MVQNLGQGGTGLRDRVYLKKGWGPESIELLEGMLEYDPEKRWSWFDFSLFVNFKGVVS